MERESKITRCRFGAPLHSIRIRVARLTNSAATMTAGRAWCSSSCAGSGEVDAVANGVKFPRVRADRRLPGQFAVNYRWLPNAKNIIAALGKKFALPLIHINVLAVQEGH